MQATPGTDQVSDHDHPLVGLAWVGLGRGGGINVLCLCLAPANYYYCSSESFIS